MPTNANSNDRIKLLEGKRARTEKRINALKKEAHSLSASPSFLHTIKILITRGMLKWGLLFGVSGIVLGAILGYLYGVDYTHSSPILGAVAGMFIGAIVGFLFGTVGRAIAIVSIAFTCGWIALIFLPKIVSWLAGRIVKKLNKRIYALEKRQFLIDTQLAKLKGFA